MGTEAGLRLKRQFKGEMGAQGVGGCTEGAGVAVKPGGSTWALCSQPADGSRVGLRGHQLTPHDAQRFVCPFLGAGSLLSLSKLWGNLDWNLGGNSATLGKK